MYISPTATLRESEDFCLLTNLHPRAFIKALGRGESIVWLLSASLCVHLILAAVVPLTADEAYAIVVSRSHALSYYDHPPLAFALARLMADLTGQEGPFFTRLPFVVMGMGSAILIFDITRRFFGTSAGRWATAAFSLSPFFFSFTQGLIMPDGPLDFFLLLSFWLIQPVLFMERSHSLSWPAAGLALGFAVMSKYQAVLFGVAALGALLASPRGRRQFVQPSLWIGFTLAFAGAVPVLVWNATHGWASFGFQTARAYHHTPLASHVNNLLTVLAGQAGYLMPLTWWISHKRIIKALRAQSDQPEFMLASLAVLPIVVFDVAALTGRHSLPHWSMSGFLFAMPLVGQWRAGQTIASLKWRLWTAGGFIVASSLLLAAQAQFDLTSHLPQPFRRDDLGWQNLPWANLPSAVPATGFVVTPDWVSAGQAGLALGQRRPVRVLGDAHQFQFMDQGKGREGTFVAAVAPGDRVDLAGLLSGYRLNGSVEIIAQPHAGHPAFNLLVVPVRMP